ncbi:exosortase F system-associated protein [Flavobacterium covae]|uniref:Exosortase F system-associated protein n=1 Tax=Flavobacterium covae TaxID=2906076 RepID=A0ABW8PH72_9FLAO|nr:MULTISPECIES: exosortase F system-associated protein [Flavobacterium]OWP80171.1 exosortase F system-associated protein [Flavobacterium covae]POR22593.1 exosortase F system-associated protein [Flavobacterium columnare]
MRNIFQNKYKIAIIILSVFGLILIRNYESNWFYDPFIAYFRGEFQGSLYPEYSLFKLVFSWLIRYSLNTVLSLVILYMLFQKNSIIKISIFLYVVLFFFLVSLIVLVLEFCDETFVMTLFYMRRFLIQPLFLILFIPAFYYQKKNLENN